MLLIESVHADAPSSIGGSATRAPSSTRVWGVSPPKCDSGLPCSERRWHSYPHPACERDVPLQQAAPRLPQHLLRVLADRRDRVHHLHAHADAQYVLIFADTSAETEG